MILSTLLAFYAFSGGEHGGGEGGLLSVDGGLAFWTVLTFVILLIILRKTAWKPILEALDKREKEIAESLAQAEEARKATARLIEENKSSMSKNNEEAQKILAEAKRTAEEQKNKMLEESKAQAKKIVADAQDEIDRKKVEAINEIKGQVASLAIEIAEKIIRQDLNSDVLKKAADKYIDEIQKN